MRAQGDYGPARHGGGDLAPGQPLRPIPAQPAVAAETAGRHDVPAFAAVSVNPTGFWSPGGEAAVPNCEYRIG